MKCKCGRYEGGFFGWIWHVFKLGCYNKDMRFHDLDSHGSVE